MGHLVVVIFDNMEEAGKVRAAIKDGEKHNMITLEDSAVVVKDEEGHVKVKDEIDRSVKVGAAGGSFFGLFVGLLFGGPIGGLIVGALGGAAFGSMMDLGVSKSFIKDVTEKMTNGTSAIFFVLNQETEASVVVGALRPYKGEILQTTLPQEAEDTLRRILKNRSGE